MSNFAFEFKLKEGYEFGEISPDEFVIFNNSGKIIHQQCIDDDDVKFNKFFRLNEYLDLDVENEKYVGHFTMKCAIYDENYGEQVKNSYPTDWRLFEYNPKDSKYIYQTHKNIIVYYDGITLSSSFKI